MNAAVITETRKVHNIKDIIDKHMAMLPDNYKLVIYHGHQREIQSVHGIKYDCNVFTLRDYNTLLTSLYFWSNLLKYERVLIFQTDSMILRTGIENFYEYDYVGAPWKFQEHGGNGGLSLRNPRAMMKTIMQKPYNASMGYEDVYFSNNLIGKLAPRKVCEKFSCETIFKLGTWGYHAIENWLSIEEVNEIKNQYDAVPEHWGISSRP